MTLAASSLALPELKGGAPSDYESETITALSLQCRDQWHNKGPRHDDVSVQFGGDDGQPCEGYAKLLCLFSYEKAQFALIHWYFLTQREQSEARPIKIASTYLKQKKLSETDATDVITVESITGRVHVIRDTQARVTKRARDTFLPERYYLNNSNGLCL